MHLTTTFVLALIQVASLVSSLPIEDDARNEQHDIHGLIRDKRHKKKDGKKDESSIPKDCSIPFVYKGIEYNGCTNVESNKPWCSKDYIYKGGWKYCKEDWLEYYQELRNTYTNEEFWKLEHDDKKKHYPKHLKDKVKKGEKIFQYEEDSFENEYGRFRKRNGTGIIDIISSVNQANDITTLEESDMFIEVPDTDALEIEGSNSKQEHGHEHKEHGHEHKEHGHKGKEHGHKGKEHGHKGKEHGHKGKEHGHKGKEHGHKGGKHKEPKHKKGKHGKHKRDTESDLQRRKRDARRDRVYLWIDRMVPYEIDSSLADSSNVINYALNEIQTRTCIKFRELKNGDTANNWIKFVKKTGCWSSVGRTFWKKGYQEISLGTNCLYPGIILHEVLHALGFWHEQSRPDRDQYVEIFWENIKPDEAHNFNRYDFANADVLGSPYDYGSIMHYGKYSFALNAELPTIQSLYNPAQEIGQRNGLSMIDVYQIRKLYDCENTGTGWSNWSEFGPCNDECVKERSRFCMNPVDKTSCKGAVSTDGALLHWGVDAEPRKCSSDECYAPVDGHWNRWGSWNECSVSCDIGTQTRTRECTDPAPKNGGKECVGDVSSTQPCEKRSCNAGPYDCNFELDSEPTCSWFQGSGDDFEWTRRSGTTPSSSTGPNGDHTSGSGFYMYIETSSPAQAGWKARLVSGYLSPITRCMTFAYNMYGITTGSLNVYVKNIVTSEESLVFTKSGDQLSGWKVEKLDVSASNNYQVIIEGVRGTGFQGDTGIDDIVIKDGSCFTTPPPPEPAVPTVESVGCFHSKGYIDGKRIFSDLKDLRPHIDWKNLTETATGIVKLCSAFARDQNYEYFAVEYWGECWTGPTDQINYGRDGEAEDCWPMKSLDKGAFIVGKSYTAMVYKWVNV